MSTAVHGLQGLRVPPQQRALVRQRGRLLARLGEVEVRGGKVSSHPTSLQTKRYGDVISFSTERSWGASVHVRGATVVKERDRSQKVSDEIRQCTLHITHRRQNTVNVMSGEVRARLKKLKKHYIQTGNGKAP